MKTFSDLVYSAFNKKYWHNISEYCNRKHHARSWNFNYRPYRRGKNRCIVCGAKIGKIKCERRSNRQYLVDNIYTSSPLLDILRKKN